jgi:predicted dehydrogenase
MVTKDPSVVTTDLSSNGTETESMTRNPRIAVIGSGYWGKNLVRNFDHLHALKLICDRSETALNSFKETYPDVETCLALNDVLSRKDIEGVVIATPAETHFTLALEGLLAGKHVFVEKPLALAEREVQELVMQSEKNQLTLMVGHLLQYHPVFVRLKALTASGELGRINYIYSHRLNLGKIRREENILWSFAPHDISMILTLAGEEPESILATGGNYLHKKIADVTTTHLEFPSGLQAQIFVSWLHPFKEQKLVVVGDRKMAVFDDTQPWKDKLLIYPHEIKWQNGLPVPAKGEPERLNIPQAEPLRLECEHFLECISNGFQPLTDGLEGLRVLRVLNASQRSLDENGGRILMGEPGDNLQVRSSSIPMTAGPSVSDW